MDTRKLRMAAELDRWAKKHLIARLAAQRMLQVLKESIHENEADQEVAKMVEEWVGSMIFPASSALALPSWKT